MARGRRRTVTTIDNAPHDIGAPDALQVVAESAPLPPLPVVVGGVRRSAPAEDPAAVYLAALAASGRRSMAARLDAVAALFGAEDWGEIPWERVRDTHVAAIKERLQQQGLSPASVNTTLAALRGIAQAARDLGLLDAADLERIRAVKPVRAAPLPAGRSAAPEELRALLQACARDPSPAGPRDAAIIATLYAGGLRREELAGLRLTDYAAPAHTLTIRPGRGRRERLVPLARGAAGALDDWLAVRGDHHGALFLPVNRAGRVRGTSLTAQSVYSAVVKRVAEAGLTASLSPEDLRRTFVGALIESGADLATVQQLAGHASLATTARYDRRRHAADPDIDALIDVPYSRDI